MTNEVVTAVVEATKAVNFWDVHGIWFLIFMGMFPRLTMLFTGICFMGFAHPVLFWVGWVLSPRLVAAILATTFYWQTNPTLCVITWIIALGSGSTSKARINYTVDTARRHSSRHSNWRRRQGWIR